MDNKKVTIVVNADDFGRSGTRNQAIDNCMRMGYIDQTSLMVNMKQFTDEAVELAKNGNYLDKIGLHLNLTLGEPLTENIKHTPLCKDGFFIGNHNVISTFKKFMNKTCILAMREECEAQINKYIEYGFAPTHIDSHNWVNLEFPVWIALKPLLEKYGFNTLRPMRPNLKKVYARSIYFIKVAIYHRVSDIFIRKSKCIKSVYSSNLEEFLEAKGSYDFAEVFCHPDIKDGEIYDFSWSYNGEDYKTMEYVYNKMKEYKNHTTYKKYFS